MLTMLPELPIRLINFARRIYSGNGRLLQGDIYRSWVDGRAAWREIKSDCLGKSEPPLCHRQPLCNHAAVLSRRGGHLLSRADCRTAYQPRNEEHEEHTYRSISGPLSYPQASLFLASVSTHSKAARSRPAVSFHALLIHLLLLIGDRGKYFPNSDKAAQCVIRPVEINCRGTRAESSPRLFLPAANSRISEIALPATVPRELLAKTV